MATMLDTYNARKTENNPGLNLGKLGKWNTPNGLNDPLPYSDNSSYKIDEPGIKKLENKFGKTRYQLGPLGGGSQNSPGYTPSKTWSDVTPRK